MREDNSKAGLYGSGKFTVGQPLTSHITEAHQAVINAMGGLLYGNQGGYQAITPEEAMARLHTYDVMKERLGTCSTPRQRKKENRE